MKKSIIPFNFATDFSEIGHGHVVGYFIDHSQKPRIHNSSILLFDFKENISPEMVQAKGYQPTPTLGENPTQACGRNDEMK